METKNRVRKSRRMSTENLTMGAVLTALIVVLQLAAIGVKLIMPFLPFTFSLVLIPIVIGAAKCGPYMGGWLGFVFGVVVLLSGDANTFLVIDPVGTILTVLAKGFLCGFASGLVYRLIEKKQQTVAVYTAAAVCPIVNTGVFFLGCVLFFMDTVAEWAMAFGFGENVALYMFLVLAGKNFLIEFVSNVLLSRIIIRVLGMKKESKAPLSAGEGFEDGQN